MHQQRIIIPSTAKLAAALVGDEAIRALMARALEESSARGTLDNALAHRLQLLGAAITVAMPTEPVVAEEPE